MIRGSPISYRGASVGKKLVADGKCHMAESQCGDEICVYNGIAIGLREDFSLSLNSCFIDIVTEDLLLN